MSDNEKIPVTGRDSSSEAATGKENLDYPQYSTTDISLSSNRFELAALGRGSLTPKQLAALDSLRSQMDSDAYNQFREAAGVPAWTANFKLSKGQARRLIEVILAAGEAER